MANAPPNLLIQLCPPVTIRLARPTRGALASDKGACGVKRRHLVELEDLPWWPRVFRDAATDYLVTALRHAGTYLGLVPRLAAALKRSRRDPGRRPLLRRRRPVGRTSSRHSARRAWT